VYADRASLPDAHLVAADIDHSITELLGAGSQVWLSRRQAADVRSEGAEVPSPVPA